MRGIIECMTCHQHLPWDEFEIRRSARGRLRECRVCQCQRLARASRKRATAYEHRADVYLARRRSRAAEQARRIEDARAQAGRD